MYQRLQIMSVFASRARPGANKKVGLVRVRLETVERVKEVLEHLLLYIGLAIYTAIGAKVETFHILWKSCDCDCDVSGLNGVGNWESFVVKYSMTNKRSWDNNRCSK